MSFLKAWPVTKLLSKAGDPVEIQYSFSDLFMYI